MSNGLDLSKMDGQRVVALLLSVMHHGMSCFSSVAKPASADKVLETAMAFENQISRDRTTRNSRWREED